jgi:hypothetical protein
MMGIFCLAFLAGCASDIDKVVQPEPMSPLTVCANLSAICPEDPASCRDAFRFIWDVAPQFGVDLACLQTAETPYVARGCGYPCGGVVR